MNTRRAKNLALVLASIGVAALWMIAFQSTNATVAAVGPLPVFTAATAEGPRSAVVLGDSYAAGNGTDSVSKGFAALLGSEMGWQTTVMGQPGTGYVNPGPEKLNGAAFGRRIGDVVKLTPDVVVVEGGGNDQTLSVSPGREQREATAALGTLRSGLPDTTIYVVGVFNYWGGTLNSGDAALNDAIHAATNVTAGARFIDASDWFTPTSARQYMSDDNVHPNEAGHTFIAQQMAEAIRGFK